MITQEIQHFPHGIKPKKALKQLAALDITILQIVSEVFMTLEVEKWNRLNLFPVKI
jgi:hypothetical protein